MLALNARQHGQKVWHLRRADKRPSLRLLAGTLIASCGLWSPALTFAGSVALIDVDAREASRGIERGHPKLPVIAGPVTLLYPKWLPGEHAPTGPIASLSGLAMSVAGRAVTWHRDEVDMYAFHVDIPAGASVPDSCFIPRGSVATICSTRRICGCRADGSTRQRCHAWAPPTMASSSRPCR